MISKANLCHRCDRCAARALRLLSAAEEAEIVLSSFLNQGSMSPHRARQAVRKLRHALKLLGISTPTRLPR